MVAEIQLKVIIDHFKSKIEKVYGVCANIVVSHLADISNVNENTLDWISAARVDKVKAIENSKARVIVVGEDIEYTQSMREQSKVVIVVDDAKKFLAYVANEYWVERKEAYIHPSAIIHSEAIIDKTAYIDAGCVIGKCIIKANTVIKPNVTVYDNVEIGENCLVQAGTVIGTDGLGCQRETDGTLVKFPHFGGVVIGNNVEIGANCQIAKGALSNTIIGDGCKINGLCFIAHNCILAENVWITGNTMLAGSVKVDKNATIFSKVIVREQVHIGQSARIGMGSVVTKNVPENEVWLGIPAKRF